jgi:ubiquinol-cytochrome c reductase cytochrome b subunit
MQVEGCMACHMINNAGGQRGADLTHVGNNLTDDQFTWRILHGGGGMPAYGNVMTSGQLNQLIAFLSNPKNERTEPPP